MAVVGIDLGTTYCSISYINEVTETVEMIDNPQRGGKSIASVIGFDDDEIHYNLDAVNLKKNSAHNVLYDSKRYLGRRFDNISENFNLSKNNFKLENLNNNNKPYYSVIHKKKNFYLPPEVVSGLILNYLKRISIQVLNEIDGCVITVPAHFTNVEREATLLAAELAGLNVLQLLNEPSAAAISYGYEQGIKGTVLVFDYGGGTLDISVVKIEENKFDVIGYGGDQILGGRDIDNALLDYSIEMFKTVCNVHHDNAKKRAILLEKCESAKIYLSEPTKFKTKIFDYNENQSITITKQLFNELCRPFFKKAIETIDKVLNKLKIIKNSINEVVMTGGTSRIPIVQEMVMQYFGKKPHCHDPEGAIAKGAAIVANKIHKALNLDLLDQVRYSIGINVVNTKVEDGPTLFSIIIPLGTKIPCYMTKQYCTVNDYQTTSRIAIAEGESEYFDGNTYIDEFRLTDLPPKKKGEVSYDVTVAIDKSGVLNVKAFEKTKNLSASKQMLRTGNYYKGSEKEEIRNIFYSIIKN